MICILTQTHDAHADYVIAELNRRRIPVFRFNTGEFPLNARMTGRMTDAEWSADIVYGGRHLRTTEITSIWYRRPDRCRVLETYTPGQRDFALRETRGTIGGVFAAIECLWVNHPAANAVANSKALQLQVARRGGLRTPRTLLTNDPDAARAFFAECDGRVIYKTVTAGIVAARVPTNIYTSEVRPADLDQLERVRFVPCLFQERVDKDFELRIVVFGGRLFAARIESQQSEESRIDWRRGQRTRALSWGVYDLPPRVEAGCLSLMASLGLTFGAIDMIVTPAGDHVFLEVNPNGQWAFVEFETGLPLREALIDMLVSGNSSGHLEPARV